MSMAPEIIQRRLRQLALSRKLLFLGLLVWIGAVAWLVNAYPLMTNPLHLLGQLEQGTLDEGTLSIIAMLTPLMFGLVALLMLFLMLLGLGCMIQEKRLLELLKRNT